MTNTNNCNEISLDKIFATTDAKKCNKRTLGKIMKIINETQSEFHQKGIPATH